MENVDAKSTFCACYLPFVLGRVVDRLTFYMLVFVLAVVLLIVCALFTNPIFVGCSFTFINPVHFENAPWTCQFCSSFLLLSFSFIFFCAARFRWELCVKAHCGVNKWGNQQINNRREGWRRKKYGAASQYDPIRLTQFERILKTE